MCDPLSCEGEIFPPAAQRSPLISQSGSCDARLNGNFAIAVATSWHGTLRKKAIPLTLGPPALCRNVEVSLYIVAVQGQYFI